MNGDLIPAMVAAGGGSAMLAGIWTHEHRRDETMRRSRIRLGLRFPIGLEPSQALAALDGLAGLPHTSELIAEVVAGEDSIAHFLWVPESIRASAQSTMAGVIPSLRITDAAASPDDRATLALRLAIPPSRCVLSSENTVAASRALLSGMVGLRSDERVIVRVALRPESARSWQESEHPSYRERDIARHWRHKTSLPGFTTAGTVLIRARHMGRARELAAHIENTIRSRRQIGGVRVTREHGNRSLASMPRTTRASGWLSTPELLGLTGWPLGSEIAIAGVEVGAARALPVPSGVPREGRQLFVGRDGSGAERPVALSADGARHHMAVVGPSGVGKSALLARCVLSDIERGCGGIAIDPKSDGTETTAQRVKPEHAERIVVLDAGDDSRPVPGIDVLHSGDPDVCADVLARTLKSMFPDWGIRSELWGRLAIRTLSATPNATLLDMGRLFADEAYRRAAVARLDDEFLISSWQSYEALSPAAKVDVVQAPMARIMALLSRPRVRAVLASPEPKLDIARLLEQRKFLLVSLAPGVLGEAAPLLSSAVMFAAWSAIEARVALPPEKRHLVSLYVDEFATVANGLPSDFELVAERARGLGAGLTVAMQTLGRVPEPTRSALLGNAATFITFRAPGEEAAAVARQLPGLTAQDVQSLGRFEVAARVGTGTGSSVSVVTGRTEPLPAKTGQAKAIRDRSARLYGSTQQPQVCHEQPARSEGDGDDPVGVQRRRA